MTMKKPYPRLKQKPTLSELDLEETYPATAWREPQKMHRFAFDDTVLASGLMCRFCTAMYGVGGAQVDDLPQTRAEFDEHMQEHLENLKAQAEQKAVRQ